MTDHTHTPDRHTIGSSVNRSDGSYIAGGECTECGKPIRRVHPFGVHDDGNPNPWIVYDTDARTPLEAIQPVPEHGVAFTQADCLTHYAPAEGRLQIRLRDGDQWHFLAAIYYDREACETTLTTSEGKAAKVWPTRQLQIRRVKDDTCGRCVLCDTVWPCIPAGLTLHTEARDRGLVSAELRDHTGVVVASRRQILPDSISFAAALMCIDSSTWSSPAPAGLTS